MIYRTVKPLLVDATQVREPAYVTTQAGLVHVQPGDWLIRDTQGNITRCDDINFKCSYEPVDPSNDLEYFTEGKPCGC